jgi:hypothetical protein
VATAKALAAEDVHLADISTAQGGLAPRNVRRMDIFSGQRRGRGRGAPRSRAAPGPNEAPLLGEDPSAIPPRPPYHPYNSNRQLTKAFPIRCFPRGADGLDTRLATRSPVIVPSAALGRDAAARRRSGLRAMVAARARRGMETRQRCRRGRRGERAAAELVEPPRPPPWATPREPLCRKPSRAATTRAAPATRRVHGGSRCGVRSKGGDTRWTAAILELPSFFHIVGTSCTNARCSVR